MTVTTARTYVRLDRAQLAMADRSAIESLRAKVAARKASDPPKPTVAQMTRITQDVIAGVSLTDTAEAMDLPVWVDAQTWVLDAIATFGTWVAHSVRTASVALEVPEGYEKGAAHKRDLSKALGMIAAIDPASDVIARFVDRTYAARPTTLSYLMVAGVWNHVSRGRAGSLDLVSDDRVFQEAVVEAFDLLDIAREDGVSAVRTLLAADPSETQVIAAAARKAEWLAEPVMRAIVRACETAETSPVAAARLQRELSGLGLRVQARPAEFTPKGVRDLTLGQVQRICAAAGLKIQTESRLEETEIRTGLKDLGLSGDIDRLVPEALRLADKGLLDEFWDAMASRVEGDPAWVTQLAELTAR